MVLGPSAHSDGPTRAGCWPRRDPGRTGRCRRDAPPGGGQVSAGAVRAVRFPGSVLRLAGPRPPGVHGVRGSGLPGRVSEPVTPSRSSAGETAEARGCDEVQAALPVRSRPRHVGLEHAAVCFLRPRRPAFIHARGPLNRPACPGFAVRPALALSSRTVPVPPESAHPLALKACRARPRACRLPAGPRVGRTN